MCTLFFLNSDRAVIIVVVFISMDSYRGRASFYFPRPLSLALPGDSSSQAALLVGRRPAPWRRGPSPGDTTQIVINASIPCRQLPRGGFFVYPLLNDPSHGGNRHAQRERRTFNQRDDSLSTRHASCTMQWKHLYIFRDTTSILSFFRPLCWCQRSPFSLQYSSRPRVKIDRCRCKRDPPYFVSPAI